MKKIIYLLIISLGFASCEDLLTEEPKRIATETFYNTADEINSAIIPIYYELQRGLRKNFHTIPESQVDYGFARGSYLVINQFQGFDVTNINRMSDVWTRIYMAIRDANLVIQNAPKSKEATPAEINAFVGEAKFLRAFCYFQLVRYWGDVPLRTEDNMLEMAVPREPSSSIYTFILKDLTFAEANLPDTPKQWGRPTQNAAKTMLTEVYLCMENYTLARTKALEVINSKKHALVNVTKADDFYNIIGVGVNGTSEEIFYLKYNTEYGNEFAGMGHYNKSIYLNKHGNNGLYTDSVTNKFVKNWNYKDLRKRFNFYSSGTVNGSKTTLFYKKFKDEAAVDIYCAVDNPIYRYADLLLFYAEADCRINNGPTDDGVEKLNMVHRRAYGKNPLVASSVDFKKADYTKDTFLDLILKERGYETLFEGKRYLDLKRMGKYAQTIYDAYGITIDNKILLYPIPTDEINYNDAIDEDDQNPGY